MVKHRSEASTDARPLKAATPRLIAIDGINLQAGLAQARAALKEGGRGRGGVSRWDASGLFDQLLVGGEQAGRPSARTLLLLYASDLAFRLKWEIEPALNDGKVVAAVPYVETAISFGRAARAAGRLAGEPVSVRPGTGRSTLHQSSVTTNPVAASEGVRGIRVRGSRRARAGIDEASTADADARSPRCRRRTSKGKVNDPRRLRLWVVLLLPIAAAAACSPKTSPAATPSPPPQLIQEMKAFERSQGFEPTKNFGHVGGPDAIYRCYFAGKLVLPDSYQQLRVAEGKESGCAIDEEKYDVFFYPIEAIATGSVPVTPSLSRASQERMLVVVPHEDAHSQRAIRKAPPEIAEATATLIGFVTAAQFAKANYGPSSAVARELEGEAGLFLTKANVVNAYWDKLSALYRSFGKGQITAAQALDGKQRLFAELREACTAIRPDPVSFNKCPAAMNNAGLAFDRTYTREYPQVFERFQASTTAAWQRGFRR
jgi:hypothetical protein